MSEELITADRAGTWALGDLRVNRVGFGAMRLTGSAAFHLGVPADRERSIGTLRRALELGINHIDTAAFYFSSLRSANEMISTALSPYPDDLVIATKVGPGRDATGAWTEFARPELLRSQVEENLRQLGRDQLDVVNLRVIGPESLAEHFGALSDLREAGLIRHLGVSGVNLSQLEEARRIAPVVCVQNRYSVEKRDLAGEVVLSACADAGIAFVPYFSLAGDGTSYGRSGEEHDEVLAVARSHGASPTQVRLAWTLALGPHVLAIPGTGSAKHLGENVAAAALVLSDSELASLNALAG